MSAALKRLKIKPWENYSRDELIIKFLPLAEMSIPPSMSVSKRKEFILLTEISVWITNSLKNSNMKSTQVLSKVKETFDKNMTSTINNFLD